MTRRRFVVGFVLGMAVGLVLGMAVGFVVPAVGGGVVHVHASQRWDRPTPLLRAETRRFGRLGADVVTWTEVRERARALRRPGWRAYAPTGRTDVAVSWRADQWRPLARRTFWLAPRTTVVVVVLQGATQRVLATVGHLPSHVEYGDTWRRGVAAKVDAWQQAATNWRPALRHLRQRWRPDVVIVAADWNTDVRRPSWRARVNAAFPRMRLTWRQPLPDRGTHRGGRIIDATLTRSAGRARLLPHNDASDHRAYRERLVDTR